MDATRFGQIARELLKLLDQQVAALAGRRFDEFSRDEVHAYHARKRRILKLRSDLSKFLAAA
jgi:hypothetical protein